MTSFHSQKSDRFTESVPTKLANGSKTSDCEPNRDSHQTKPKMNDTLPSDQVPNREHSFTFGTVQKRQPYSMECSTHEPFSIWSNGSIGQEIVNSDGMTIAWTTDPWVAQVICKLLTENDGLLG